MAPSPDPWDAVQMLWNPRQAGTGAARAPLALALLILGVAGAIADYPFLLRFGSPSWLETRVEAAPGGMYPLSMIFFLGLAWGAPLLLPVLALVTTQTLKFYFFFVLDVSAKTGEVFRVVAYGMLPLVFERMLVAIIRLTGGLETKLYNPVASNPAFFLPAADTPIFRYELVRGIDVFAVWSVAIVALGLAGLTGTRARAVLPVPVGVWLAAAFLRAALLS